MLKVARLAGLAALLSLSTVAAAHAQTVIITNAPQGTTLEFVLENMTEGTAMVDAKGNATVVANQAHLGTQKIDATVLVDNCGTTRRVVVIERTGSRPSAGTCTRTEIEGVYLVQQITTIVINVNNMPPTLLQRQGPAPAAWLEPTTQGNIAHLAYKRHFVASAGYGLMEFKNFPIVSCGDILGCIYDKVSESPTAAVSYWFLPYVAAEGGYVRFSRLTAGADGTTFNFNNDFEGGAITFSGVGAIPAEKWTVFGKWGGNYQGSTYTTHETVFDAGAGDGNEMRLVAGGTQTLQYHTAGWGWQWGGGVEYWPTKLIGVYGEGGKIFVKGHDTHGGEGSLDDTANYVFVGVRLRIPSFF
jgi:hypothetical protein